MRTPLSKIPKKCSYMIKLAKSLKANSAIAPPSRVQVEITNRCNLKCVMCNRWKWITEDKKTSEELGTERLCELFSELKKMGVEEILLTGGETMIRTDFMILLSFISDLGMSVSIITNGTLVTTEIAQKLAAASAKVTFSIDGDMETHDRIRGVKGTFRRAVEGIKKVVRANRKTGTIAEVAINYTVQKGNIRDMLNLLSSAEALGVDTVLYTIVHGSPDVAPGDDELEMLHEELSKLRKSAKLSHTRVVISDMVRAFADGTLPVADVKAGLPALSLFRDQPVPCFAAYRTSFIDCFGRVFPCCYCYLDNASFNKYEKAREKFYLGSILDTGFPEIWYGAIGGYKKFRKNTDPVDIDRFSICCGQCYDYYLFRKMNRVFQVLNKMPLIL